MALKAASLWKKALKPRGDPSVNGASQKDKATVNFSFKEKTP
jgi:hypothetical protein